MYTINAPKKFQSSLSLYDGVDKENRIAAIALHKCGIERARIFGLLKPLHIARVFVYRPLGRLKCRWEDDIRMDLSEIGINTRN